MTSNKINITKISSVNQEKEKNTGLNLIRDKMFASIEASKRSKVPFLFISNPGNGKTTNVNTYAAIYGYHVETLSGSHFARDEILGIQANVGKAYLEILEPEWFHRIMCYSEPHYEIISSGTSFKLVENDTVDEWNKKLNSSMSNLTMLKEELKKCENDTSVDDDIAKNVKETVIKTVKNKIKMEEFNIDKYSKLLNDIEWRPARKVILFLDELGAVSGDIQAALLQLCFERKIRGDKRLPDDCIVVAAANYKGNVPSYFSIIAPELNRFCIINLLPGNKSSDIKNEDYVSLGESVIREFTQYDRHTDIASIPKYRTDFVMDETTERLLFEEVCNQLIALVKKYSSTVDTSLCQLDFRNTRFEGMFDRQDDVPEVFNFMSGRSISNYILVLKALCEMGVTNEDRAIYQPIVDGLLGLGTNTWDDSNAGFRAQLTEFQGSLYSATGQILSAFQKNTSKIIGHERNIIKDSSLIDEDSLDGKVQKAIKLSQENEFDPLSDFGDEILAKISTVFDADISPTDFKQKLLDMESNNEAIIKFRSDFEAVKQYIDLLDHYKKDRGVEAYIKALKKDVMKFKFYYTCIIQLGASKESIQ